MIRIPSIDKIISIPNNSDQFGNIWYLKNMNLDEEGYIKLSARAVALLSNEDDPNLGIPISWGRKGGVDFYLVTSDQPYNLSLSNQELSVAEDTVSGNPSLSFDSAGKWWQNLWHVTTNTAMKYKNPSGGAWTDSGISLTSGKSHPLEIFRNRATICVGNGNVVKQYTSGYGASIDLTLPSDYEVIGLKYSGNQMGIITILSPDAATGQNQEAFFFVWDGATAAANQGFAVGSDMIAGIVPYKSSWAILTRTGQLLYFNGGGFDELASLPFYFKSYVWGDSQNRDTFGEVLEVEGDLIYINVNNLLDEFGQKEERYLQNAPGGILCYDPKVKGIYHRYSPSISLASLLTVTSGNVNPTTGLLTKTAGTIPDTGNPVKYTYNRAVPIGGLTGGKIYYIIKVSSTTFKLAETKALALAGTAIVFSSTGDTNNYFLALALKDYGASRMERTGGISLMGSSSQLFNHLIFGGEYFNPDSTTSYFMLCLVVPGFRNIGYMVSPKVNASEVKDILPAVFIKHRPLETDEMIILKYKQRDILGIPVTTPQSGVSCEWISSTIFRTLADLSEILTYLQNDANECEVEIISGAGAGQMAQIEDISFVSGYYELTVDEEIEGVSASDVCDILIENWKRKGQITSEEETKGYKKFRIDENAPWTKFKIEVRGTDKTALEEVLIDNETFIPAE